MPGAIFSGKTVWEMERKSGVGEDLDTLVLDILKLSEEKVDAKKFHSKTKKNVSAEVYAM